MNLFSRISAIVGKFERVSATLDKLETAADALLAQFGGDVAADVAADQPVSKCYELFNDPRFKFRKLATVATAIGKSESETREILVGIGARPARGNDSLWCLESD